MKLLNYLLSLCCLLFALTACKDKPADYPHGKYNSQANIFFSSFAQQPKTFDPAVSYSAEEAIFIAQVVEPPLQYHYLKRPYALVPLTAAQLPQVTYLDKNFQPLAYVAVNAAAYSVYRIQIQPHIFYQPHPAFAKNTQGQYRYLDLSDHQLNSYQQLSDFKYTGTRELTADDYIYEIKRLAAPNINSPIESLMAEHIVGLKDLATVLQQHYKPKQFLDLRQYPLAGVKRIDRYTYEITIKGVFQQFPYWLASSFFAPVPWEADQLYAHHQLKKHNISFATYPVGTGAYMITENNPNSEIVLQRNPNFHHEIYPVEGEPGDAEAGYLNDAGKTLPFIDTFVFSLEKENIPRWNKFLQGYYDVSGIGADNFDQAVQMNAEGKPVLTPELQKKGIRLKSASLPSVWYFGFNMQDAVVGGDSEAQQKLRQAISIAVDTKEFIAIFLNGRGQVASSPIPPGIFGFDAEDNRQQQQITKSHSLAYAKKLLAEAGYPNGINAKTGKPLILHYDAISGLGSDERAQFQWMQEEFAKLNIQLVINDTDYNRFQDKVRSGNVQIFSWGWGADYPDPENFLFTLYGPNSKLISGGENATNYQNKQFDHLFEQMKNMPNGPARQQIINQMVAIFQHDTPWFGAFYGESYQLAHAWTVSRKINGMANNTLKYSRLDPTLRVKSQDKWNKAHYGYLLLLLFIISGSFLPFLFKYKRMQKQAPKKIKL